MELTDFHVGDIVCVHDPDDKRSKPGPWNLQVGTVVRIDEPFVYIYPHDQEFIKRWRTFGEVEGGWYPNNLEILVEYQETLGPVEAAIDRWSSYFGTKQQPEHKQS